MLQATGQTKKVFGNRWWVVIGSIIGLLVGNGAVVTFTFSLFIKPIASEFGWNRGTLSAGLTVFQFVGAFATPFAGRLADSWGVRRATLCFVTTFAVSVAALSMMRPHILLFFLLFGFCGLAGSGQSPPTYAKAITTWFDDQRGMALGIGSIGVGLGTALLPQIARFLIERFGWRDAYVGLGAMTFVIGLSSALLFIHDRMLPGLDPTHCGESPSQTDEGRVQPAGFTLVEAAKMSRAFWYLTVAIFLVSGVTNGFLAHVAPMLTDRGSSPRVAAFVLTIAGLAMILGKLASGVLVDYLFAPYVCGVFFLSSLPGIIIFNMGSSLAFPVLGIAFVGISLGAVVTLQSFLVSAYFGLRHYGEICGYFMGILLLGAGLGPWIMGATFDQAHSYYPALVGFSAALVVSSLCVSRLGPYSFTGEKADRTV